MDPCGVGLALGLDSLEVTGVSIEVQRRVFERRMQRCMSR